MRRISTRDVCRLRGSAGTSPSRRIESISLRVGHGRRAGLPRAVSTKQSSSLRSTPSWTRSGEGAEALIRVWRARSIPNGSSQPALSVEHELDPASGRVRAVQVSYYEQFPLREREVSADPEETARLLSPRILPERLSRRDVQLIRRLRFAGLHGVLRGSRPACGRRRRSDVRRSGRPPPSTRIWSGIWIAWPLKPFSCRAAGDQAGLSGRRNGRCCGETTGTVRVGRIATIGAVRSARHFLAPGAEWAAGPNDPGSAGISGTRRIRVYGRSSADVIPRHPWPDDPWTARATARAKPKRAP